MLTREIPKTEWVEYFNNLSRRFHGWNLQIEVMGADFGDQIENRAMPFQGISADIKDNEHLILVSVGDTPQAHMTHTIGDPTHIRVAQTNNNPPVVEIETASGDVTLLRFQVAERRLDIAAGELF